MFPNEHEFSYTKVRLFFWSKKSMTKIIILSKWDATPVFVETNPIYLSYIFHP